MTKNYYHLISSLPELFFKTDNAKGLDLLQIRDFILEEVSVKDSRYVYDLLSFIDNYNLLTLVYGKNRTWKRGGKLEQDIDLTDTDLPKFQRAFLDYIETYESENGVKPDEFEAEKHLYELTYSELEASKNLFVSKWNKIEKDIKNIQTAYLCRQANLPAENYLFTKDDLTESLLKSSAQDFGLSKELDYVAKLIQIFDTQNLIEREKKLDIFRWNNIDEIITYEYFTVNAALGTLQKACIIDRWAAMDSEEGERIFRKLVTELKESWNYENRG